MNHNVICYGYTVEIARTGRFDVERAKAAEIPMKFWNRLQKGETIEADGHTYHPEDVLGPQRKGLKVAYCTGYPSGGGDRTACKGCRSVYL